MDITELPDSVLVNVLKYFSLKELCTSIRQTCKKWQEVSYDLTLWKHVDFYPFGEQLTDKDFVDILERIGHHIVELSLEECGKISCLSLQSTKVYCPNLKHINIRGTSISNAGLSELFTNVEKFPCLESIVCSSSATSKITKYYQYFCDAYRVGRKFKYVTDPYNALHGQSSPEEINQSILKIAALFSDLQVLNIESSELKSEVLEHICKQNREIDTLELHGNQWLSDNLPLSVSYLKCLKKLDISSTPTNDAELIVIAQTQPLLASLNVTSCRMITDVGVSKLAEYCHDLRCLILNDSMHQSCCVTDAALHSLAAGCPCLREIHLVFSPVITDDGLCFLLSRCNQLEVINVIGCLRLTDNSLLTAAQYCPLLRVFKASECSNVSSASVNTIIKQCKKLDKLELDTCHLIVQLNFTDEKQKNKTERKLCNVGERNNLVNYLFCQALASGSSRLRVLDLSFCSNLTAHSVKELAMYCMTLRSLSIRGCYQVTDDAIQILSEHCLLLNMLDISGSSTNQSKLTDLSLHALAEHSHNLVMLSITKNQTITTTGLIQLTHNCEVLTRLNIDSSPKVNVENMIREIRTQRGSCKLHGAGNIDLVSNKTKGAIFFKLPTWKHSQ